QPPATVQAALENAYMNAPMTDLHHYRANTTGYTPAPNRYFVRLTAPVGTVPTTDWNQQKASVTGYTQPSNQYFATRARLAYHPADKTFGGFSGTNMNVQGVVEQAPTPEASAPEPTTSEITNDTSGQSKQDKLADYEADYLKRLEQDKIDAAKAAEEALIEEAKAAAAANQKGGALPKGFEKVPEPEAPKKSRGTLPKGF
ncbi:MAG TPA: trans-sialidase, partial [Nitrosopumilus sp.]|nr:trans-sialidase [Nitrosopumilus sp.]